MPLAVLALLLALAPAVAAARTTPVEPAAPPAKAPRPQLLLIHGGSFLVNDPTFKPLTEPIVRAAGFTPHYLTYPLGNMPAAVTAARAEARALRERYGGGCVYAYGSSAGGTLSALLSGQGLVAAAVAKAPVTNLVDWDWPLTRYGPEYFEGVGLSAAARYRLSPLYRPQKRPLLVIQGRDDGVVPPAMNETFAEKFQRVHLWMVPGGHYTERSRPYLIARAMEWLTRFASRQDSTTGAKAPLPGRCVPTAQPAPAATAPIPPAD